MRRPFFLLAIFLVIFILVFRLFAKEDKFFAGHISHFVQDSPRVLAIKARVVSNPYYQYAYFKKSQVFVVSPTLVKASRVWFPAYGNIRVTSYNDKQAAYGDEILFEAKLKRPFSKIKDSFDYKKYLERSGIFALATISEKNPIIITGRKAPLIRRLAYDLKDLLKRNLRSLFRRPERYFLSAILLGERQDIGKEWKDIFVKTQTMHLLAISGLHVGIIAFIILFFIGLFGTPRNFRYIATIILLVFYAIMVGGRPSVVRATVMGIVILGSYVLKRDADIYNSLGLAAAVILIFNPEALFDYGFILSFVSVLSIVYMTPRINRIFRIDKIKRITHRNRAIYYFSTLASASFAVWLGLLPLSANFFNISSPISVFVNILAIPLLFVIIALAIAALIFHPIFRFLGAIFAESTQFFIGILLSFLRSFSKLPFAYLEVRSTSFFLTILYYLILISVFESPRLKQYLLKRQI